MQILLKQKDLPEPEPRGSLLRLFDAGSGTEAPDIDAKDCRMLQLEANAVEVLSVRMPKNLLLWKTEILSADDPHDIQHTASVPVFSTMREIS